MRNRVSLHTSRRCTAAGYLLQRVKTRRRTARLRRALRAWTRPGEALVQVRRMRRFRLFISFVITFQKRRLLPVTITICGRGYNAYRLYGSYIYLRDFRLMGENT